MAANWNFNRLNEVEQLTNAREQLHQASQLVAAVGRTYNPKVRDDHFANFSWNEELEILQGQEIEGDENFSAALSLKTLNIYLVSSTNELLSNFGLNGKTQKQSLVWLEEQLAKFGLDETLLNLKLPYEIPNYPYSKGQEYNIDNTTYFEELSNYYSNTNLVLSLIVKGQVNASEICCWPHHFDLATLITLNDTGNFETSTHIGVGMSPGDSEYNQPYFYLGPWPYPNISLLPEYRGPGEWHTDGWVGGVLTASQLMANSEPEYHEKIVMNFFEWGIDKLKDLMQSS